MDVTLALEFEEEEDFSEAEPPAQVGSRRAAKEGTGFFKVCS